jgi:hypothetical protein
MRRVILFAIITSLAIVSAAAAANTLTWTGTSSNLWSDPGNWGGIAPADGDDLVFPAAAANQTNTNDLSIGFNSILYEGGAYVSNGNAITLGSGGLTVSGGSLSFANHVSLGVPQTWSFSGGGQIFIYGDIALTGRTLTIANGASASATLFSDISGSASPESIIVQGPSDLRIAGSNTFSGEVWVQSGGRLTVAGPAAVPASMSLHNDGFFDLSGFTTGIDWISGSGTFDLNGADLAASVRAVNTFVGGGTIRVSGTSASTFATFGGNSPATTATARLGNVEMDGGLFAGNVVAFGIVMLTNGATMGPLRVSGQLRPGPCSCTVSSPESYSGDLSFGSDAYYIFVTNPFNHAVSGRLNVRGSVSLAGANFSWAEFGFGPGPSSGMRPVATASDGYADTYVLIDNDGSDPVSGTFAGLPEGAVVTPFQTGRPRYRISYVGGDGNDVTLTRVPDATLTISSSSNPSAHGHPVTFTFTVSAPAGSPTPTGNVAISVSGTSAVLPLDASGVATYTTSSLPVGIPPVSGTYGGDANYLSSFASFTQQVFADGPPTTTVLTSSLNPSQAGETVVLTARVTSPDGTIPTGMVFFVDGSSGLKDATLDATGEATFTANWLAVGRHSFVAHYGGDATTHPPSRSAALIQEVRNAGAPTTVLLTSSLNPSPAGDPVVLTARVTGPDGTIPTGTVSFVDGSIDLKDVNLDATGAAAFTTSELASGAHIITAHYSGDATHLASISPPLAQTISMAMLSTTALFTSKNPSTSGEQVTLVVAVEGLPGAAMPSGNVTLIANGIQFATLTLDPTGHATTSRAFPVGTQVITAVYGGDGNYSGSAAVIFQTVAAGSTRHRAAGH